MAYVLPKLPGVNSTADYIDVGSSSLWSACPWNELLCLPVDTVNYDHYYIDEDVPHIEGELSFDFDSELEINDKAWDDAAKWSEAQHELEDTTVLSINPDPVADFLLS